jgi:hypothetical protein
MFYLSGTPKGYKGISRKIISVQARNSCCILLQGTGGGILPQYDVSFKV